MKTRIIGSLLLVVVLLALAFVTNEDSPQTIQQTPSFNNDSALKSLSIN